VFAGADDFSFSSFLSICFLSSFLSLIVINIIISVVSSR